MSRNAISKSPEERDVLKDLSDACENLFRYVGSGELADRVVGTCVRLTGSDRGSLFLATQDGRTFDENFLTARFGSGLADNVIQIASNAGIAGSVFTRNTPLVVNDADSDPRFARRIDRDTGYRTRSLLSVPVRLPDGRNIGVLQMLNSQRGGYTDSDVHVARVIAAFTAMAIEQNETLLCLGEARERLRVTRDSNERRLESRPLTSRNASLNELYEKLPLFARSESSVLVEGESGSGKEMVAQLLHKLSARAAGEFVAVNCAAIPESLFEAELFGVAKGAATGTAPRRGKLELANGGTLFLDEVGELPLAMQAKLLRALQEKAINRVGDDGPARKVDFRIVSATNRNLAEQVRAGKFREDLFYRLHVVRFHLPPLRERRGDIPDLSRGILAELARERNLKPKTLSSSAITLLEAQPWPGNIRQLQNKLEGALLASGDRAVLEPADFSLGDVGETLAAQADPFDLPGLATLDLKEARALLDRELIRRAIARCGGNKTEAAKLVGLSREGLRLALRKKRS